MRLTVLGGAAAGGNPGQGTSGYLVQARGAAIALDLGFGTLAELRLHASMRDLDAIVVSHLHLDHTGAIGVFPNARHVVQRAALDYALAPDWFCAAAFVRADFDRPGLDWCLLDEAWGDFFDLYGDGAITCLRSPGHTVGHQSFLVRTARGATLLAIDAADTMDHWEDRALPGAVTSVTEAVRSVAKLRAVAARAQARVVPGHDPVLWPTLAQSPAFY